MNKIDRWDLINYKWIEESIIQLEIANNGGYDNVSTYLDVALNCLEEEIESIEDLDIAKANLLKIGRRLNQYRAAIDEGVATLYTIRDNLINHDKVPKDHIKEDSYELQKQL